MPRRPGPLPQNAASHQLYRFLLSQPFTDSEGQTSPLFASLTDLSRATVRHAPDTAALSLEDIQRKKRNRVSLLRQALLGLRPFPDSLAAELAAAVQEHLARLPKQTRADAESLFYSHGQALAHLRHTASAAPLPAAAFSSAMASEVLVIAPFAQRGLTFRIGQEMLQAFAAMYGLTQPDLSPSAPCPHRYIFCFDDSKGVHWLLTIALWRHCTLSGIRTLYLEATPTMLRCYKLWGLPLVVLGPLRTHWGEPCYPCSLDLRTVAGSLAEKALTSQTYRRLFLHALAPDTPC